MKYTVRVGDAFQEVEVLEAEKGEYRVTLGDRVYNVNLQQIGQQSLYSIIVDGQSHEFYADVGSTTYEILIEGELFTVGVLPQGAARVTLSHGEKEPEGATLHIQSPMPGVINEIYVQPKQAVERGERLLVLEAMKMNNEIQAPRAGVVQDVLVSRGQRINKGDVLVTLT